MRLYLAWRLPFHLLYLVWVQALGFLDFLRRQIFQRSRRLAIAFARFGDPSAQGLAIRRWHSWRAKKAARAIISGLSRAIEQAETGR